MIYFTNKPNLKIATLSILFKLYALCFSIGDCHDSGGHEDICVTGAIYNYTMQLSSAYQITNLKLQCKHFIWFDPGIFHDIVWQLLQLQCCFVNDRQLNRGTYVLITFHWRCPSGLSFLLVLELQNFAVWICKRCSGKLICGWIKKPKI